MNFDIHDLQVNSQTRFVYIAFGRPDFNIARAPQLKLPTAICEWRAGANHEFRQGPMQASAAQHLAKICAESEVRKFQKCKISQRNVSECNEVRCFGEAIESLFDGPPEARNPSIEV